ncbi:purple acid phosphatase family protein [Bowmanella dokdonensis]|uniref:acid phosphatase n=1 Tax=Bowmanella dokdonensis TaxID=751969 RepID=A0A939DQ95_9ALTE|nr:tartrate-resistant acid phosphatase type 5 family protein [Bowmanella dokdonensis]MBN7826688.1 metallophosphoesterase [Bowmanella dokdonensis]
MYKKLLLLCGLLLTLLGHAAPTYDERLYASQQIQGLKVNEKALHFLVLGDWGRNGHYRQQDVAHWMEIAMHQLDGELIVTTGDNFYPDGVASVKDPYWSSSYENIYQGPNLFRPWYVTLGNHDYRGNVQAQIDYSQISQRWNLPARYYSRTFALPDSEEEVLILFIDTNPLEPQYQNREKYLATQSENARIQMVWIETQLAGSNARWKLVVGHHPLYSSGKRYGTTDGIRQVLEPMLERHQVDAYIAGHEHDLQHNQPEGKQVAHLVSGGGSSLRPVAEREFTRFAKGTAGFMALSVSPARILVQMIDAEGQLLYFTSLTKESIKQ